MPTKISLKVGDITLEQVDAIVNAANTSLLGGGGVDGAIHRAAGPELLKECRSLGGCKTSEAKLTKGYQLPARFVIHTAGPVWHGGHHNEDALLAACYRNALKLAEAHGIKTIAFPAISTGVYRFPLERAAQISIQTTLEHLKDSTLEKVIFVCFNQSNYEVYRNAHPLLSGFSHQ